MTALASATAPVEPRLPVAEGSGRSLGWWGTIALIATEAMVFALLLFANFYLRLQSPVWPLGGIRNPELLKSGIRTVVLVASSVPLHTAGRAIRRGDRRLLVWGLGIGWLMGAAFLAGHVDEYVRLWKEFRPGTNAYASSFYTITGLHAAHLVVGLVIVGYLWWRAATGRYDARHHNAVECGILYWHFVDVVWIFVYASLYLSVSWR